MADNDKDLKLKVEKNDENNPEYREYHVKKAVICKIAVFFVMLFTGTIFSLILPLRPTVSESEKRVLTDFPGFTFQSFADGTYFAGIDTWFSDTFPMRDKFTLCNEKIKRLYGFRKSMIHGEVVAGDEIPEYDYPDSTSQKDEEQTESIRDEEQTDNSDYIEEETTEAAEPAQQGEKFGSVYVLEDSAYAYYSFLKDNSDRYTELVNSLSKMLEGQSDLYNMIVPTSIDIVLDGNIRRGLTSSDQYAAIMYMQSRMNSSVKKVNVYSALKARKDEYIYFRTDHHWTALGAYYAYCEFVKSMGLEPNTLDSYECINMGQFNGSFCSQTGAASLKNNPDNVVAYKPISTNSMKFLKKGAMINYNIITDVSDWNKSSKYSAFIGGDNAYSQIHNPERTDGSSCVVIKESFGNAFVPFIADHFQDIYVIDYRYYSGTISDLVKEKDIGTVLLLNNVAATSTDARINELKKVCR
ncbi:MAG: DHHW family protein [Lachnospira sp.]